MSEEIDMLFDLESFTIPSIDKKCISETCDIGAFAEMRFCGMAISLGFEVFLPFSHSTKTDVILLSMESKPIRVQVKKATYQKKQNANHGDYWKFMVGSGRPSCAANPTDYGLRYRKYEKDDFDVLAAYILERDVFAFYNLSEIHGSSTCRWDANKRSNNWEIFTNYKSC
jgi:hypothetical protein